MTTANFAGDPLPIDAVLADLRRALEGSTSAVLVAPPGAGKTTRVPLALLGSPWLGDNKILVLEPRRLAARAAAERMASLLGESVGETIGLRARLVSKVSRKTRIEVITEGVFTRMILDDPALDGIGAVLFDEFHERSLDADLGLALALDAREGLRDDLRLLVMSATLDGARVASLLGQSEADAVPVIESEGRAFRVETHYLGRDTNNRIEEQMLAAIDVALRAEPGSILAFLPGQGEIRRVEQGLRDRISDPAIDIEPLYGAMDMRAQDRAVQPAAKGRRKIVLATSIAETSLTIEGVRVVIDCGLSRVPRYEPDAGVTRLATVRVSRASADQRRGRAGRTQPGVCFRLWDAPQTASLAAFSEPEIKAADLSGLLLDCAAWGAGDPLQLRWLDPPPAAALAAARDELRTLGGLDATGRITALGKRLRALPMPPRLAAMVTSSASYRQGSAVAPVNAAAEIAAILVERGLGGTDTDLAHRLDAFRRDRSRRAEDMRRLVSGWARMATEARDTRTPGAPGTPAPSSAMLLALAYPDRIAKARGAPGQFLLANGRGAALDAGDALAKAAYLVVADMAGTAAKTRILLASQLDEAELALVAGDRIDESDEVMFDAQTLGLRARRIRRLDAIVLASEPRAVVPSPQTALQLAAGIAALGIGRLPWSKAQLQLRARVAFLSNAARDSEAGNWPDLSDEALAVFAGEWLAPFLTAKTRLAEIGALDLGVALDALLPWEMKRKLDSDAPTHFDAPTGNRHAIDYEGPGAPALHIRVQELFGLREHPSIAGRRLPLTLHLLSPAHRPIQITRDLPGFWTGSWSAVKADMRGQYPKHPWPDDPVTAMPTARAKPRAR